MMDSMVKKAVNCRACKNKGLKKIVSLGSTPLANSFLKKNELKKKEEFFPLELVFCKNCNLLQLSHIVNPNLMFKNYLYVSSTSNVFVKHFEIFAKDVKKMLRLKKKDLVIDIGSNDGILLKPFKKLGVKVLGVDPAKNVAAIANKNGLKTICSYFNAKTADRIVKNYGKAKIITAANVFAHTNNWEELIKAVNITLSDDGVFIIEAPYLVDFLDKNLFDTIYHEHLSYIALRPLILFFERNGMKVFDAQRVDSHGGSIRVFVKKTEANYQVKSVVKNLIKLELEKGLDKKQTYLNFARRFEKNKKNLLKILKKIKTDKKRIIGYGAPAKGNTLLNYFGIDNKIVDYIVDDSPLKQGLFTPGTHILIKAPRALEKDRFNYIIILAWNFADSIMTKYHNLKKRGISFIVPIPFPKIIK